MNENSISLLFQFFPCLNRAMMMSGEPPLVRLFNGLISSLSTGNMLCQKEVPCVILVKLPGHP